MWTAYDTVLCVYAQRTCPRLDCEQRARSPIASEVVIMRAAKAEVSEFTGCDANFEGRSLLDYRCTGFLFVDIVIRDSVMPLPWGSAASALPGDSLKRWGMDTGTYNSRECLESPNCLLRGLYQRNVCRCQELHHDVDRSRRARPIVKPAIAQVLSRYRYVNPTRSSMPAALYRRTRPIGQRRKPSDPPYS